MSPERRQRLIESLRTLVGWIGQLIGFLARLMGGVWTRLSGRARIAVVLATLIVLAANTEAVPTVSATAQGLAVLLVALIGFWMILTSPFRR